MFLPTSSFSVVVVALVLRARGGGRYGLGSFFWVTDVGSAVFSLHVTHGDRGSSRLRSPALLPILFLHAPNFMTLM